MVTAMEFSKKLVVFIWMVVLVLCAIVILCTFSQIDASGIESMAALAFAAADVISGFYLWKAKNENRLKLTKSMVTQWANDYGIDAVVSLTEIVLKE